MQPRKPIIPLDMVPYGLGPMLSTQYEAANRLDPTGIPDVETFLEMFLYSRRVVLTQDMLDKQLDKAMFIPGVLLNGTVGPASARVMLINEIPSRNLLMGSTGYVGGDIVTGHTHMGDAISVLLEELNQCELTADDINNMYLTSFVKFPRLVDKKQIKSAWIKESMHLLYQELLLVQPELILTFGKAPSAFFTGFPLSKAFGHTFPMKYNYVGIEDLEPEAQRFYNDAGQFEAKVVSTSSPGAVLANPEMKPSFSSGLNKFASLVRGNTHAVKAQEGCNANGVKQRTIDNALELSNLVDELIASNITEFAVDVEWGGGEHYLDVGNALRTVQFAWSHVDSAVIVLHKCGMKPEFKPRLVDAYAQLRRLFQRSDVRVICHSIASDIPALSHIGVDLRSQVFFDTMLASHLLDATMSHKLEDLAIRYIQHWQRQDFKLIHWLKDNPIKEGRAYADIPDEILVPYGGDDAVATFILYDIFTEKLNLEANSGIRALFYDLVMPAALSIMSIEMTGIRMDQDRLLVMQEIYESKYTELLEAFRRKIGKPNFNPNSPKQKVELLFDELNLPKIKSTASSGRSLQWDEVISKGDQDKYTPSTDDEVLQILAVKSGVAKALHQVTLLSTTIKYFLPPRRIDNTGRLSYCDGLLGFVKGDGRLHTSISQMLKTGRLASRKPNIMNLPNKQEGAVRDNHNALLIR